jgi:hypothetical protein
MYGTLARYRPLPGQERAVQEYGRRWLRDRAPAVPGFVAVYVLTPKDRPGELIALTLFASKASYHQNAADPDEDRWYRQLRVLLAEEPTWHDGEIVALEPATVPL